MRANPKITLVVCGLAAVSAASAVPVYSLRYLAGFGDRTFAMDVNNAGVVAGYAARPSDPDLACTWTDGVVTSLGTLGGEFSKGYGINNLGQVVGLSTTAAGGPGHAFLYSNGVMTDILPNRRFSSAAAINDSGQIAGAWGDADGNNFAFMWENGTMSDFGLGPGSRSRDINNAGQVVGYRQVQGGSRAFTTTTEAWNF